MLHRIRMMFQVWIHNLFWNGTFYFLHFQEHSRNVSRKKDINAVQIILARVTKRDQREDNFLLIGWNLLEVCIVNLYSDGLPSSFQILSFAYSLRGKFYKMNSTTFYIMPPFFTNNSGGSRWRTPPWPKFFQISCSFFWKNWQNLMLVPPEGWHPLLQGIVEPLLNKFSMISLLYSPLSPFYPSHENHQPHMPHSHACPPPKPHTHSPAMHIPLPRMPPQPCMPPAMHVPGHVCPQPCMPPSKVMHAPIHAHSPQPWMTPSHACLPVNRMTKWCKNSTLPQTSFAGGNKDFPNTQQIKNNGNNPKYTAHYNV